MKFGDPIPENPNSDSIKRRNVITYFDYFNKLTAIFNKRPIWSRKRLEQLDSFQSGHYMLTELLPYVAYFYLSGPWKGLWCRY